MVLSSQPVTDRVMRAATLPETTSGPTGHPATAGTSAFTRHPGRWIDGWDPENAAQWDHGGGARIARRNLAISVFAEFLGFGVFALWAIVVPQLKSYGYVGSAALSETQQFWLLSIPTLVGASLRIPYTLAVPRFGGRNWTVVSALLLLIPTTGLALAVAHRASFGILLVMAALAGFGGGNFASSMTNISFFYRHAEKGKALGFNAAGGNLGTAAVQFSIPFVVTIGAAGAGGTGAPNLPLAGWILVPLILLAAALAFVRMDNLTVASPEAARRRRGAEVTVGSDEGAGNDRTSFAMAARARHTWILSFLYVGSFGSFIGFAGVFPKIMSDAFPAHGLKLAFLGALVGSLTRPLGGIVADRVGGWKVTVVSFLAMALGAYGAITALQAKNFALFLATFLLLFVFTGVGNGSIYRMIPAVFNASATDHSPTGQAVTKRVAAGAIGVVGAIGAFGGFVIPQGFAQSKTHTISPAHPTGTIVPALAVIIGIYLVMAAVTWFAYGRKGSSLKGARI